MINSISDVSKYSELAVFECGREECIKEKIIVLTKKDYHLIHYVYAGKGTLILNDKKYILKKGQMFYIPPQTDAIYYSDNDDPWSYNWIGFDGEKAKEYLSILNINLDHPIIDDKDKKYKGYFTKISGRYFDNGVIDLVSLGILYELFGEMLNGVNPVKENRNAKVVVKLAKEFIHNNYQFRITINDIARNANVTPNYLSAVFQKEEGMSTKTYLIKVRMEKALALLKTKQFKIKEVSEAVGYSNQLHFSSEFKKYYGYAPSEVE